MPEQTPSPRPTTYGDVRRLIARHDLGWQVLASIPDDTPLIRPLLGGPPPEPADPALRVDVLRLVDDLPTPWQIALAPTAGFVTDFVPRTPITATGGLEGLAVRPILKGSVLSLLKARPRAVDWRTRNGWPTFTRTRNQFKSEHCWIFAPTGIVEAMTRIEHCVWAPRSEGDAVKGIGALVGQCGDAVTTLNWAKDNGQADPGCVPWPFPATHDDGYWRPAPTACRTGSTQLTTVATAANRAGRTVRIPAFTKLSNVEDMKNWIWQVGPVVASSITIYPDFYGYSDITTVYRAAPNQKADGTHVVDVVGYDDSRRAWLIRNSWGGDPQTGYNWGDHGYGWIGYGEIGIDTNVMYGLRGTDPDPWSKRFNHNGAMFESGNGANHNNFELFVHSPSGGIAHWWRDNGNGNLPWARATEFGGDAGSEPTATGTTYNRNIELVYRSTAGRLRHWWFDQSNRRWNDGGTFGPINATGTPGFVESGYGPGNFEVVTALTTGQMQHWWRDGGGWHAGPTFGNEAVVVGSSGRRPGFPPKLPTFPNPVGEVGGSLIQTTRGSLELVCVLKNGTLQHWSRADGTTWAWSLVTTFAQGCRTAPVMIEGQYGRDDEFASGNYELVVALQDGTMQHWWRDAAGTWRASASIGAGIDRVLSIVQGSFGFNLEVVARRQDGNMQHFWRDGAGWHDGVIIGPSL